MDDESREKKRGNLHEFNKVVRPLIQWLNDKYHPHVRAIVTPTSASVVEDLMGVTVKDNASQVASQVKRPIKEKEYPGEREKINCCEIKRDSDDGSHCFVCYEDLDELGCCYNPGELGDCPDKRRYDRCDNGNARDGCIDMLLSFCNGYINR